jgi:hypothetical protein
MKEENNQRSKWLHLRLTEKEQQQILAQFKKTDTRRISDFARRILLGKPMIGSYRNSSMDEFVVELVRLRTELNHIGNNFNQLVKKLHTTQQTESIAALLVGYELDKRMLLKHIAIIQSSIEKNADKW